MVNSSERGIKEILALLDSARRFKEWLRDRPADANLMKEYYNAIRKDSWIDGLPSKAVRWLLFNPLAALVPGGALVGLGISAADTFLVDKIAQGWKPSQFVEGPLSRFAKAKA